MLMMINTSKTLPITNPAVFMQHQVRPAPLPSDRERLSRPGSLRVFLCDRRGMWCMNEGVPTQGEFEMTDPVYEQLIVKDLPVEDTLERPKCFCEYVLVMNRGTTPVVTHPSPALRGPFFVERYVTSHPSVVDGFTIPQARCKVDMQDTDVDAIIAALGTRHQRQVMRSSGKL